MATNKYLQILEQMQLQMRRMGNKKELMTIAETCDYLDLSESYLYKLTSERKIPHYKPLNKKLYFKRSEIDGWIFDQPVTTRDKFLDRALIPISGKQKPRKGKNS